MWAKVVLLCAVLCARTADAEVVNDTAPCVPPASGFNPCTHTYEAQSYDGWYNNPANVAYGSADMPMERKMLSAYTDGVYDPSGADRPNVMLISNLTQQGLTGRSSFVRSTLYIFFGQQVVEEVLDAQRPGCPPEYFNMLIPRCHPLYDPQCRGDQYIPFLRSRYDFRTGYAPGTPRQQLNEISPWFDGGLMYGPNKAWADTLRLFSGGQLAYQLNGVVRTEPLNNLNDIRRSLPPPNVIGLPFANPPPPILSASIPEEDGLDRLMSVNRFWRIGNPRGNENPFLLAMGIFWYRVHQYWAYELHRYYLNQTDPELRELAEEDEYIYNRARQFTIATHQHIVYNEWLPLFLPRKFPNGRIQPYASTPGYSAYFGKSGYNPGLNPQIAHVFQSAAMRFGHTSVTPGAWRRLGVRSNTTGGDPTCYFGSPIGRDRTYNDSNGPRTFNAESSFREIFEYFRDSTGQDNMAIFDYLRTTTPPNFDFITDERYVYQRRTGTEGQLMDSVRTCNSFFFPQQFLTESDVARLFEGMASSRVEREDFIITPDLRGQVFGPLDFSRRELMAINLQRGRDHGLPDYNSARRAYGLPAITSFEQLNPYYGVDTTNTVDRDSGLTLGDLGEEITRDIERLREVYKDDISKCDIWACGLAETTPNFGPGELFTEVLHDQFMRIRHGDRFWYENTENGLFSAGEIEMINSLTMHELIRVTMDLDIDVMQPTPFQWTQNRAYCPAPYQLSELYMEDCTQRYTFDYYLESDYQIPLIWGIVFLYIYLCVMVLILVGELGKRRRAKLLASKRPPPKEKKLPGQDVTDGSGDVLVATELKSGLKGVKQLVSMKFGEAPQKLILLHYGGKVIRQIDLRYQTLITIRRAFDNDRLFLIHIPKEYDVILQAASAVERAVFIDKLQGYFNEIGIGCEIEEPQGKVLMKQAFTKKDRQQLLEAFFKAVFSEDAHEQVEASGVVNRHRDVLSCELSREEFADAMSMKPDSLFVEQMFQLIDTDGNGFVSFREFLDMIVIFSKGSPDEKLKLMFNMYDVDRSGSLDVGEFKEMLKGMMEMVNASVNPDQMDSLIDSMFAAAGFQNKTQLNFDDFLVLMRDHKEELSDARLNVAGYDAPEAKKSEKAQLESAEGGDLPARYKSRETAPARARRTVIRAYQPPPQQGASKTSTGTVDIPTTKRNLPKGSVFRYFEVFKRYVENYKLHIFWISLFQLTVAGIFIERAYYYSVEREFAGLRRIAGNGVTITRGAASAMMFTYSVLLVTMARNFITYLRETPVNNYVPLDSYIAFHKHVALTALLFTVMHGIGHGINFYHISTQTANDLTCLFREVYHRSHQLPKFTYWLFLTMTGFSSFLLSVVTVVIFVFATQYTRRYWFQAFWFTHHWYYVFYVLMFFHGSGRLVQDPLFGNFFLGPGIVFALDQLISLARNKIEVSIVKAELLPSEVVGIYFRRPITFDYKAGQWVRIASLAQNSGEYHPFTLSSAPHEENLSLHIRVVGPWTFNFRESIDPAVLRGQPYPKLFLDGPYGEGHQDWSRYDVSILVGGGIGVTPFASILKELVHRFNIGARVQCKKVYFIWVTRNQKKFEWFTDTIREVEQADRKELVETHIFVTAFFDKFDLRTTMLYICERHFQKISNQSLFTGLRAVTHFGRPDFQSFFDNLQEEHYHLPKIGVFSCGPPGMTKGVEEACKATNRYEGPAFVHHFENF